MRAHGWTRRRRIGIALAGLSLGTIVGGVPLASAGSIAYIDGHEVWVSTFDGSRKERLSSGENQWQEVAAADNGRIIAARNEAGKISQLTQIQLWENNGQVISQGPLPSKTGWTSYAAPLSLDLTSDGVFAVYGYSGQTGFYPTAIVLARPLRDPRQHPDQPRADRADRLRMADDVRPACHCRERRPRIRTGFRHEQSVLDHLEHAARHVRDGPRTGAGRRRGNGQDDRS